LRGARRGRCTRSSRRPATPVAKAANAARSAPVLRLVEFATKDTVEAMQRLLDLAKEGKLRGSAMCLITVDGCEEVIFTGHYKAEPAKAANSAMRLSWKLTQAQDVE
jgi:hypothetical protein